MSNSRIAVTGLSRQATEEYESSILQGLHQLHKVGCLIPMILVGHGVKLDLIGLPRDFSSIFGELRVMRLELMSLVWGTIWGIVILMWCSIVILLLPLTIIVTRISTGIRARVPGTLVSLPLGGS